MKNTAITICTIFTISLCGTASFASDEFGASFTRDTPAALTDSADIDDGFDMENFRPELIEPAAGDYFDSEEKGIENTAPQKHADTEMENEIDL